MRCGVVSSSPVGGNSNSKTQPVSFTHGGKVDVFGKVGMSKFVAKLRSKHDVERTNTKPKTTQRVPCNHVDVDDVNGDTCNKDPGSKRGRGGNIVISRSAVNGRSNVD